MREFRLTRHVRTAFGLTAVYMAVFCLNGCGAKVEMKELPKPVDEKITTSDETKIKEFLDKAGRKGQPMSITDAGDHWLVEFQPEAVPRPGGGRPVPTGPESVRIDKATGAVTSALGGGPGTGQ